ncbi:GNAT domain-containing protein, partial [Crepidotus variabilis]
MSENITPVVTPRLVTLRSRLPSARIFLRSPKKTDSYSLTCRAHDPECTKYLPWIANPKTPITVESNERQIKNWRASSFVKEIFFCIVLLDKTEAKQDPSQDRLATIGETGLAPLDLDKKTAEVGVMLASGAIRGKGYAVEALDMCFAYGFDVLGLGSIYVNTDRDNEPMKGLMEKKFGVEAVWREKQLDWSFATDRKWWDQRQAEKGEQKMIVDDKVEDWFEEK